MIDLIKKSFCQFWKFKTEWDLVVQTHSFWMWTTFFHAALISSYRSNQIYEYLFIIKMSSLSVYYIYVCTIQRNPWLNKLRFWMTESFHVQTLNKQWVILVWPVDLVHNNALNGLLVLCVLCIITHHSWRAYFFSLGLANKNRKHFFYFCYFLFGIETFGEEKLEIRRAKGSKGMLYSLNHTIRM